MTKMRMMMQSDGSDSGESSAKEDVSPYEAPLVPKFGLVDASDDDEAAPMEHC